MSMENRAVQRIVFRLLAAIVRGVCRTLRVKRVHALAVDALRSEKKNFVVAFWHGSMALGWHAHAPAQTETMSALVSLSKDGAILAAVLERWGFTLIRGSSHIGGKEALQSMVDAASRGSSLCVTPDGPTGPRHRMKPGALLTAQRAGIPLVIVGIAAKNKKVFTRSWDKFEIPLPFSRVCLWYEGPFMIPADADRETVNAMLETVQQRLDDAHLNAHHALGIEVIE
jgi:lysophospholipid acyltransferase (LPLAT)-like uncharacterized protein